MDAQDGPDGAGHVTPLNDEHVIKRDWLGDEQRDAGASALGSEHRVNIISAEAGVGKSTVAAEIAEGDREAGRDVLMIGPDEQIGWKCAEGRIKAVTLAKFLLDDTLQQSAQGNVIWLDEAGMVGAVELAKLMRAGKEAHSIFWQGIRGRISQSRVGDRSRCWSPSRASSLSG